MYALLNLEVVPYMTIALITFASLVVLGSIQFSKNLMLYGSEYKEIIDDGNLNEQEKEFYNVAHEMKIASSLPLCQSYML